LVEVGVASDAGRGSVVATDEHPFWVESEKRWSNAVDLKPGHRLETGDHRDATVTGTRSWSETRRVYNLTVDTDHTYYVLAGQTPVLTHNCGETTTLYRTSPIERGRSELDEGLNEAHFPRSSDGEFDGAAHFGNELTATLWARGSSSTHGVGFKIEVPNAWLRKNIDDGLVEEMGDFMPGQVEYVVYKELFGELNKFPRSPWSGRR